MWDMKEQSVRVIQCFFERSKREFFWWSQIYSTVQKGHKENPEKVNGDCYGYDLNGGQVNSRIWILTVDQKSAPV